MKEKVLSLLKETQGFISGQELCEGLKVSRTAVWKTIQQLKTEGYQIEAVRNRGYRLVSSPDIMAEAEVSSKLNTRVMGHPCLFYRETDSTNDRVKQLAEEGMPHGTLICADMQSGGKGRRGRPWISPLGESVYMSLLLRPHIGTARASMLTLVMGLAAAKACSETLCSVMEHAPRVEIKWPNDLVVEGKKLAGILTELSAEVGYIYYVVIGIGINVNTKTFEGELAETAVSMCQVAGTGFFRAELAARCINYFEYYYDIFAKTEDLSGLKEEYESFLVNKGRQVCVLEPNHEFCGTARGINSYGQLLVEREDGEITAVYAGEVSVRGVYGYV